MCAITFVAATSSEAVWDIGSDTTQQPEMYVLATHTGGVTFQTSFINHNTTATWRLPRAWWKTRGRHPQGLDHQ